MANLSKYERLSAGAATAVFRNKNYKSGEKDWQIRGTTYSLPLEVVKQVRDYCNSLVGDKLEAVSKKDSTLAEQYLEMKNLFRVFGENVKPNFAVKSGTLSEMYPAGIHKTTPKIKEEMGSEHDLCLRFGDKYLAIEFDASRKKWVVLGAAEPATIRFDYGTVMSTEGEIKILLGVVSINGSDDIEDRFLSKVGIKRDEKNKKKDAYPASEVQTAFSKNNVAILTEMLTVPSTGGGNWTYTFADDVFDFGKYPVVSLKKEKRSKENQTWINYVVNVIDASGSEVSVRLDSKDQTIWNTLSSTYPWTDENGNTYNDNGEVDENDFLACIDDDEKQEYCIVYFGKTKKTKTYKGVTSEYWETNINFEVVGSENENSFQKLSPDEISAYSGKSSKSGSATPIKKTPITGVDDLLATADELEEAIPF